MSARHRGPCAARRRRIKDHLAARDGLACFYCGLRFAALTEATIDHLVPHSQLRTWVQANLVLACLACNQAKGDKLPQAFLRPAGYGPGLVPLPVAPGPGLRLARHLPPQRVRSVARLLSGMLSAPDRAADRPLSRGNRLPVSVALSACVSVALSACVSAPVSGGVS